MNKRRFTILALGVVIIGLLYWTGPTIWTVAMTEVRYVRTDDDRIQVIQRHRFKHPENAIVSIDFLPDGKKLGWTTVEYDDPPFFRRGIQVHNPAVAPWEQRGMKLDEWWDSLPDHRKLR